MSRLDHALQDDTRLQFPSPRGAPPEGLIVIATDLAAFFALVQRLGRNEALVLLLIRALRARNGLLEIRVNDLAWMLRTSNRKVIRWLDRLVRHEIVIYTVQDFWGVDVVKVEIVPQAAESRFERRVEQQLPTHWFPTYLPLYGRVTFTVMLYFVWCEIDRAMTHVDHLAASARLRGRLHAVWHLRRLRNRGVLVHGREGVLIFRDPPPPTDFQRLLLRYLAIPHLRRSLAHVGWLLLGVLAVCVALYVVLGRHTFMTR
ncbi:MAG TPA: hypothetical protein VFO89_08100 [Thermoanaerobaculia bacterium]|nr:hypothetical protein [Thermoanaerobaculia bacterium]